MNDNREIIDNAIKKTNCSEYGYESQKIEYNIWALKYNRNIYKTQFITTYIIFVLILLLVLFGMYLSYEQFKKGDITATKIAIGKGSIEINSSVLGAIILIISFSFFYTYIKHVYPINYDNSVIITDETETN